MESYVLLSALYLTLRDERRKNENKENKRTDDKLAVDKFREK